MSGLKKDLGLWQGMGLLATSLLGTGIFVVPATAASLAGGASLWAWVLLIVLVLPIAFTFARLGRRYPHAGGAPHLIGLAFGNGAERFSAFLFLAVLPVGLPAALTIAAGFWHALFDLGEWTLWAIQLLTLLGVFLLGLRGARSSGNLQLLIALAILGLTLLIWFKGDLSWRDAAQPLPTAAEWPAMGTALAVMFWCFVGIEAFTHLGEEAQPTYENKGLFARLVAGEAFGAKAGTPVQSPLFYVHWDMAEGVRAAPPPPKAKGGYSERALFVAKGRIEVDGRSFHEGQMVVLSANAEPTVTALAPSSVMVLGGEPVGERLIWWNFASSSQARMDQAKADWKAGRMSLPHADDLEFIPLPDEPAQAQAAPAPVEPKPTDPV